MKKWLMPMLIAVSAILAGCGGGGATCASGCKSTGTGSTVTATTPSIAVAISSSTVTNAAPATVTATLLDATNSPVAGSVVNFAVASTVGSLSATTALTDSTGKASVLLSPATGKSSGADVVTVSASVNSVLVTGTVGYQLSAVSAAFSTFVTDAGATAGVPLSAYGQADLTLTLTGVSQASPAALVVTSDCVSRGKATISPATTTNTTGTATFIYQDTGGCGSVLTSDTLSASITGSAVSPKTLSVFLTRPAVNSVTFDSSTPTTIFLKGSGYVESSQVKFKVVDAAGNPLPNQLVSLTLSTFAGGVQLDQLPVTGTLPPVNGAALETKQSDANGIVSVIVNSGTVPTPVRVIASLVVNGVTISTVSSSLSIATGLPSEVNFSLAQQTINIEGMDRDGTPNVYTVRAADRSGNPVPDGTSVVFWAEGGQVQASALTTTVNGNSSAVANFTSQAYRPPDGRVTVTAYAIGEESFIDLNGNNVWDPGEPFQDLGNVTKDIKFDNIFDAANDEFINLFALNQSAQTTCSVPTYSKFVLDNSIPSEPGTCDGVWTAKTYVRRSVETVFSTSRALPMWYASSTKLNGEGLSSSCNVVTIADASPISGVTTSPVTFPNRSLNDVANSGSWYSGDSGSSGTMTIWGSDDNPNRFNPLPAGTIVTASTPTVLFSTSILGGSPVANSSDPQPIVVGYTSTGATSGVVILSFTTPANVTSTATINVVIGARPSVCTALPAFP